MVILQGSSCPFSREVSPSRSGGYSPAKFGGMHDGCLFRREARIASADRRRNAVRGGGPFCWPSLSARLAWRHRWRSTRVLRYQEQRLAQARFRFDAQRRVAGIASQFDRALGAIRALSAFYAGSEHVERDEFHAFAELLRADVPGIQMLGWVPAVPAAQRDDHEQDTSGKRVRQNTRLSSTAGGPDVPAEARAEHYPLCYVEPEEGSPFPLGFDLGTQPDWLAAMQRTGQVDAMVGAVTRLPGAEPASWPALLVFKPVSTKGPDVEAGVPSPNAQHGFVLGVFQIGELAQMPAAGERFGGNQHAAV